MQTAVHRVEKHAPLYGVTTLENRLGAFLTERRFQTSLLIGFSGLALLMASKFVGVRFSRAMMASFPIYIVFFAAIAFCIFFPEIVLWLPRHLLPESVGCFKNPSGPGYLCP